MAKFDLGSFGKRKPKVAPTPYGKEPVSSETNSAPKYKAPRIAKSAFYKTVFGQIFKWLGYLILLVIAAYLIFAVTIIRFIPTMDSSLGWAVPVKNMTFPGGKVTAGSDIVVNLQTAQGSNTFDRLQQAVSIADDLAVVEVLAGPNGRITWAETGLVAVDGNPLTTTLVDNPNKEFLSDEYIVRCVAGSCVKNSGMIVGADKIYGEPLKDYETEG